jgi:hypothetical protein
VYPHFGHNKLPSGNLFAVAPHFGHTGASGFTGAAAGFAAAIAGFAPACAVAGTGVTAGLAPAGVACIGLAGFTGVTALAGCGCAG